MPRKWSKVVSEGNDPVPQEEEYGSDQPTLAHVYRLFEERFDRQLKVMKSHFDKLDELADEMIATKQRLAGLEQNVRHGDRRPIRHQDSQSYEGRCSRSSDK